jgi:type III secretory pathway component EscR
MIRLLISLCIFAPIFLNGQEEFSNVSIHSNQIDFSTQDDVQTYQGYPVFISENKKSIIGLKSNNLTSNYYTESSQFYLWNLLSFNNSCFFVVKNFLQKLHS